MNKYVRDVITFPRDARRSWTYAGPIGLWRELRVRTLDRIASSGSSIVLEHVIDDLPHFALPSDVRVEPFTKSDWSPLLELVSPARVAAFAGRARNGRECRVAWRGERAVGFAWISTSVNARLERQPLPLPADALYHWDLFVASTERGSGVGVALAFGGLQEFQRHGFVRTWRVIDADNLPSLNGARKAAAPSTRCVGAVHHVRVLGASRSWYARGLEKPVLSRARAIVELQVST